MDPQFWLARWENQEIGFHQEQINLHLQQLWSALGVAAGQPVFVPLCGKSRDMLWLSGQGHPVLGVEISPLAVEAFFEENGLRPEQTVHGAFTEYRSGGLRILCGDFFALQPADLHGAAAVYDRASLIALPPTLRVQYARKMSELLGTGARLLLITLDYPQAEMDGPPFAVGQAEVEGLYSDAFEIEVCCELDVLEEQPRFRDKGLTRLTERVYTLRRR